MFNDAKAVGKKAEVELTEVAGSSPVVPATHSK